jgi:1,4-dihydroxy-2-naphthoyl-CoA hydrolase
MGTESSQMNTLPPMEGLSQTLDIDLVEATRERVVMRMPVTLRHRQPWGFLHGGASLALAESAATVGAFLNCPPGMGAFGQQINANHIPSLREGILTATATPLHVGRTSQVWEIKIRDEREKLICVSLCTLAVVQIGIDRASEEGRQA